MPVECTASSFMARRPWRVHAGLALALAASLIPRLGREVALSSHESLLAATARNMLENRAVVLPDGTCPSPYLVPNFNGEPRLRKPPLPYWLVAALGRFTGRINEWTARLPAAMAAVATALALAWLVKQENGWPEGWLAGLAAATMVGFLVMAGRAMADMPLTFFTTACCAALWAAQSRRGRARFGWLMAAATAAGLAVLTKGPAPLLVLPGPALLVTAMMARDLWGRRREDAKATADRWWTVAGLVGATAVFLAIALPWPILVWAKVPEAVSIWKTESVARATGDFGHEEPAYFYLLRLPVLILPWAYFFLHGAVMAVRRAAARPDERPWLLFVGAWLLVPLVAFSAAAGKQDHYLLPVLPAAAVYTGMAMKHLFTPTSPAAERAGRRVALAHGLAFIAAGAAAIVYVAHVHGPHLGAAILLGGLLAAGGAAAVVLARQRRWIHSQAALLAAMLIAFPLAWTTLGGPVDKAGLARRFGQDVARIVPARAPLFFLHEPNATVVFYADRTIPLLTGPEALEQAADRAGPLFVIGRTGCPPGPPSAMSWEPLVHVDDPDRPNKGFCLFRRIPRNEQGRAPTPLPAARAGARTQWRTCETGKAIL